MKNHFKERPIKIAELGVLRGETIPIFFNNLNVKEYIGVDLFDCYEDNNQDGSYKLMKENGVILYFLKPRIEIIDSLNVLLILYL